jgi:putative membrane protein
MHRIHSFTLATALAVAFTAGNVADAQAPRPQDQSKPAQPPARDSQTAKSGTVTSADTEFVQKAAAAGRMEVEHGKMAASKASNTQVKAYANTLVKDHTSANQQLMAIAKRKNIEIADQQTHGRGSQMAGGSASTTTTATKSGANRTATSGTTGTTGASGGVPTTGEARDRQASGMAHTEPWMSATGAAFDRGFIEAQVKAHQDAVALFEQQANGGSDNDLKAFAQKQLPGLRNHLKQAQDLRAKLGSTN